MPDPRVSKYVVPDELKERMKRSEQVFGVSHQDFMRQMSDASQGDTKYTVPNDLRQRMQRSEEVFGVPHQDFQKQLGVSRQKAEDNWDAHVRREKKIQRRREEGALKDRSTTPPGSPPPPRQHFGSLLPIADNDPEPDEPQQYSVPDWYNKINPQGQKMKALMKSRNPRDRQVITALSSMKECIGRCETEKSKPKLMQYFNELRNHIHKAEFLEVNDVILKKVHVLDNGLTRIFSPHHQLLTFPWDLRADALQLYTRWCSRIFSIDLLRGIVLAKSKEKGDNRSADQIDRAYKSAHPSTPKLYGHNGLINGQWWPTQLCTVRDGAHGSPQAGIYGEKAHGAYSIVLSGGHGYADQDNGTEIWYTGTDSKDSNPTENTLRMLESATALVKNPVRVIRSWNLKKANPYRPLRGFRYDGLYDVVEYKLLDPRIASYGFRLVRRAGQDPIRCEDDMARRPTRWEVEEYDKLRDLERGVGRESW